MEIKPKISVITVSKNSGSSIEKTILSVISQTYDNLEYIIVDGHSHDDTLSILSKYENKITKIISEPDNGIYNAMNKGIAISSGDLIMFINSNDLFFSSNVIEKISDKINKLNNVDIFYGNVLIEDKINNKSNIWKATPISKFSLFRGAIPHPATIYKKKVFDICGNFDESLKIAGDYEWTIRAFLKFNLNFYYLNETIAVFKKGGISTSDNYALMQDKEKNFIRNRYYTSLEKKYFNLRWFFKKI